MAGKLQTLLERDGVKITHNPGEHGAGGSGVYRVTRSDGDSFAGGMHVTTAIRDIDGVIWVNYENRSAAIVYGMVQNDCYTPEEIVEQVADAVAHTL